MKFRILNSNYQLRNVVRVDSADNEGECNVEKKVIKVKKSLNKDGKLLAILHEFLHAYQDEVGLTEKFSETFEEVICTTLSNALVGNFDIKLKK